MKTFNSVNKKRYYPLTITLLCVVFGFLVGPLSSNAQTTISVDANYQPCTVTGFYQNSKGVKANFFRIVPNPNHGIFTLQFLSNSTTNAGLCSLEIFDLVGKEVFQQPIFVNEKTQAGISVELKKLPMGVYILKLSLPSGAVHSQKLIIE